MNTYNDYHSNLQDDGLTVDQAERQALLDEDWTQADEDEALARREALIFGAAVENG